MLQSTGSQSRTRLSDGTEGICFHASPSTGPVLAYPPPTAMSPGLFSLSASLLLSFK